MTVPRNTYCSRRRPETDFICSLTPPAFYVILTINKRSSQFICSQDWSLTYRRAPLSDFERTMPLPSSQSRFFHDYVAFGFLLHPCPGPRVNPLGMHTSPSSCSSSFFRTGKNPMFRMQIVLDPHGHFITTVSSAGHPLHSFVFFGFLWFVVFFFVCGWGWCGLGVFLFFCGFGFWGGPLSDPHRSLYMNPQLVPSFFSSLPLSAFPRRRG